MIIFEIWLPKFFLRLTYVVMLPLCAIFWLSAWAWAASATDAFSGVPMSTGIDAFDRFRASMTACAVLGAFNW